MNEQELREQIAKEIEEAMVYTPVEWASKVVSGEAYAYQQGIFNGRNQAIAIVKGQKL